MQPKNSDLSALVGRIFPQTNAAGSGRVGGVERVLSGLLGAWLFRRAARSEGWAKLPLAVLGGLAVQRAVTGHSKVYEALGVRSDEGVAGLIPAALPEPPPMPLLLHVEIAKPKEEVFQRLMNLPKEALPQEELIALHRFGPRLRLWLEGAPGGMREYELEITRETEGKELALAARPSDRIHAVEIRLADLVGETSGTTLSVFLERKQSWLKNLGSAIGVDHDQQVVSKYLGYFKKLLEEGAVDGQESRTPDYH